MLIVSPCFVEEGDHRIITIHLSTAGIFCLCFPCREKWDAMNLTSHTGLWISAGPKSAVRKFLFKYVFTIWNGLVISALIFRSGSVLWIAYTKSTDNYIGHSPSVSLYFICFICKPCNSLHNRKLSKFGVSLLKPEPRLRGATGSVLNSLRTLPCHIIR